MSLPLSFLSRDLLRYSREGHELTNANNLKFEIGSKFSNFE